MGDIVKGVASLFGGRKRRQEQKAANTAQLDTARRRQDAFDLQNVYSGLQGPDVSTMGYDPSQAQVGQLAPAQQAQLAQLGPSQGYEAQGYTAQGYDPTLTSVAGLQRGAETGLTNTMANLQVSTAAAEMQAREADQVFSSKSRFSGTSRDRRWRGDGLSCSSSKIKSWCCCINRPAG